MTEIPFSEDEQTFQLLFMVENVPAKTFFWAQGWPQFIPSTSQGCPTLPVPGRSLLIHHKCKIYVLGLFLQV